MARRKFIAGNWKMNKGPLDADRLAMELRSALAEHNRAEVAVMPPFISIPAVVARLRHSNVMVGGQDLHTEASGAFTGAVSGEMLRQAGCTHVIVGHSERRQIFGETDELVGKKTNAALRFGLIPIVCVGETLAERQAGRVEEVVSRQLAGALSGLQADQVATLVLAYEPVWAIGTGQTASPAQAQQVHAFIRGWLLERYPRYVAEQLRIQYGGSVKADNAAELLSQPDIDGALVGGASLKCEDFTAIVASA